MDTTKKDQTSHNNNQDIDEGSYLSKRLCYILRYGAAKEGLQLYPGGKFMTQ